MITFCVSIIEINIFCWKRVISVLISPFLEFLFWNYLEDIILICFIEFIKKLLSSNSSLIISIYSCSLSSEIMIINNQTFQKNLLLLNAESTILFLSLLIILFAYSIFLFVGLVVLLFLGEKWIRSALLFIITVYHSNIIYWSCVLSPRGLEGVPCYPLCALMYPFCFLPGLFRFVYIPLPYKYF